MRDFVAKRIRLRSGERLSVLMHQGMPVQLAVLFLNRYRTRGSAASTVHQVCEFLALLHNHLAGLGVDLWERLTAGRLRARTRRSSSSSSLGRPTRSATA